MDPILEEQKGLWDRLELAYLQEKRDASVGAIMPRSVVLGWTFCEGLERRYQSTPHLRVERYLDLITDRFVSFNRTHIYI